VIDTKRLNDQGQKFVDVSFRAARIIKGKEKGDLGKGRFSEAEIRQKPMKHARISEKSIIQTQDGWGREEEGRIIYPLQLGATLMNA